MPYNPTITDEVQEELDNPAERGFPTSSDNAGKNQIPDFKSDPLGHALWRAEHGSDELYEKYLDWFLSEKSLKDKREWDEGITQRYIDTLKKNGISPYIMSGAIPSAAGSSFNSVSGSQMTSAANNRRSNDTEVAGDVMQIVGRVISVVGIVIAAAMAA